MTNTTPVRKQYLEIKRQYPNAIVFFRLGDFYETFDGDAEIAARELDIVLTSRNVARDQRIPMAGVPHHAAENYIARLIEKGYHVAVVEQIGDDPVNGLMPRDVVRVVTPGTVMEPALLREKQNNYLMAIKPVFGLDGYIILSAGIAYADISTGEFAATEIIGDDVRNLVQQEIARLTPRECLISETLASEDGDLLAFEGLHLTAFADWHFDTGTAENILLNHFGVTDLTAFGIDDKAHAISAAGALFAYLQETQKTALNQITSLQTYDTGEFMILDAPTRRNLELTATIRGGKTRGSLLGILDLTTTSMGGRLLRKWINQPLLDIAKLNHRLDLIEAFFVDGLLRMQMTATLKKVCDIERLTNRVISGTVNPKELISLKETLELIPALRGTLIGQVQVLKDLAYQLDPLDEISDLIGRALVDDPPASTSTVGLIRAGYSPELDAILHASSDAREFINGLEKAERERTGIKSLKVGFNKVFGYYIEITHANSDDVPENYIRKQTLVNAERYITPEMKDAEVRLLNAEEEIHSMELKLFRELLTTIGEYREKLIATSRAIAELDVITALAEAAAKNNYVRPTLTEEDILEICAGRHPVVEQYLTGERFVPNETSFSNQERIHVITGPNMSGKSTYLRQVALIVFMAQIGSFVPADEALIGLVDRIFTRIGAQDEIHAGQSTFMVEMIETAVILQQSTHKSLIILDEIGRGTSTYDGLAIARAVIEYLHNHPRMGGKTLFATHYHELTELENILPAVANYNVAVAEEGGNIAFLHTISRGKADKSYGIHVAQLAGVPNSVVKRAAEILFELESQANVWEIAGQSVQQMGSAAHPQQLDFFQSLPHPVLEELRMMKIEMMSPIDAITRLYELQRKIERDD